MDLTKEQLKKRKQMILNLKKEIKTLESTFISTDESSCGITKAQAEASGGTIYWERASLQGGMSSCPPSIPSCMNCQQFKRTCSAINCGEFEEWQAEKIGIICGRKVETRTAIGK